MCTIFEIGMYIIIAASIVVIFTGLVKFYIWLSDKFK